MNCDRFDERVQQLLDRREDPRNDVELVVHSQHCDRCCGSFESAVAIVDFFADCPAIESVPEGFADRVLAEVGRNQELAPGSMAGLGLGQWLDDVTAATSVAGAVDIAARSKTSVTRTPLITWVLGAAAALLVAVFLGAPRSADAPTVAQIPAQREALEPGRIPFVGFNLNRVRVSEWTPVLTTIGDESLEVVRPITDGFSVAYTLLRWHLLGGSGGLPADIRLDQVRDNWS